MPAGALNIRALEDVILLRILTAGEVGRTRPEIGRDLYPFAAHRLSPAEWRSYLETVIADLRKRELVSLTRGGRFCISDAGRAELERRLGCAIPRTMDWNEAKVTVLIAHALGAAQGGGRRLKALKGSTGLRRAVLNWRFGLDLASKLTAAQVRNALAMKALRDAFGNAFSSSKRATIPGDIGRLIAAQLLEHARPFKSDQQLIQLLAAEAAGAKQGDVPALRLAIVRQFLCPARGAIHAQAGAVNERANERCGVKRARPAAPGDAPGKRDLVFFAAEVNRLAGHGAHGFPGNRKSFISDVWHAFTQEHSDWEMSETRFKSLLAEGHRAGLVQLANADLRNAANLQAIQASAIRDRNTEWHLIRVKED